MAELPKVDASPAIVPLLATAHKIGGTVVQFSKKLDVNDKITKAKEHPMVKKALDKKDMYITVLGMGMVFHGSQFSKLLLCFQIIHLFCWERLSSSITEFCSDATVASDKMKADSTDEHPAATTEETSKHAKKRDAKKAAAQAPDTKEKDAASVMKLLKALNVEKMSKAFQHVLTAMLSCMLVIRGGLSRNLLVGYLLVNALVDKHTVFLEFPGHEDFQAWTDLLIKGAFYCVFLTMAVLTPPLAMALLASIYGVKMILEYGGAIAKASGREEALEKFQSSKKGLMAMAGLVSAGVFWQLWSWASGSGLSIYLKAAYLPYVIGESLMGLL